MPTPKTEPSAFNRLMCTFFFGLAGFAGAEDVAAAEDDAPW